jgi:hypothetical protein
MAAPIAAWGFDAGSGTTVADDSGNGHTATLGSATYTASGHTNSGLTNTTANSTGASATVPAITVAAVTLMAWIKPLDLTAGSGRFACGVVQSGGGTDIAIFAQRGDFSTPNVLQCDIRVSGGLVAVNGAALTVGTWTHVAVTFDGTNIKLYTNGTLTTTVANTGTVSLGTTMYLAGALAAATQGSNVAIDDARYFSTDEGANISTWMSTPVAGAAVADTSGFFAFF